MSNISDEAVEAALAVLSDEMGFEGEWHIIREPLRAALSAAAPHMAGEPVAWLHELKETGGFGDVETLSLHEDNPWRHVMPDGSQYICTPLYAAPPPSLLDEVKAVLEPFAQLGAAMLPADAHDKSPWATAPDVTPVKDLSMYQFTFADFRAAAALLAKLKESQP